MSRYLAPGFSYRYFWETMRKRLLKFDLAAKSDQTEQNILDEMREFMSQLLSDGQIEREPDIFCFWKECETCYEVYFNKQFSEELIHHRNRFN